MGNKMVVITIVSMAVMISACASSGDNWPKETAIKHDANTSSWQKTDKADSASKEPSNSYWKDQSRY